MNINCNNRGDNGRNPYVTNIMCETLQNPFFRRALWTGEHLQVTLMCIPMGSEIGLEIHEDTDQMLYIEQGNALVKMGKSQQNMDYCRCVSEGDVILIPVGMWHNLLNSGQTSLKVWSVYAPPHHPAGVLHCTRADAEA